MEVICVVPTIISTTIYSSIVFAVREMTTFSQTRRRTAIALFPRLLYYIQVGEDIGTVYSRDKFVRCSRYGRCHDGIDNRCRLLLLIFGGSGRLSGSGLPAQALLQSIATSYHGSSWTESSPSRHPGSFRWAAKRLSYPLLIAICRKFIQFPVRNVQLSIVNLCGSGWPSGNIVWVCSTANSSKKHVGRADGKVCRLNTAHCAKPGK